MKTAYVSYQEDAEQFHVSLQYKNQTLGLDRQFNFSRKMSENVSVFLDRITSSFDKTLSKQKKKMKKRKSEDPPIAEPCLEVNAELTLCGEVVPGSTICSDIIPVCKDVCLRIFGTEYQLVLNAPWVDNITLPCSIMSGFFVCSNKLEMSFASKEDSLFTWYRSTTPESNSTPDASAWIEVGAGYMYTPCAEDIGCRLKLTCVPANRERQGPMKEVISKSCVEAGPGDCPFEERHAFTKQRLKGGDR